MLVLVLPDRVFALLGDLRGDRQLGDRPPLLLFRIEPRVEQHQEDPLRPAEVLDVGRRQLAVPVVAEAQHLQLAAERGDVLFGGLARGRVGLDGVLFGRQSKGVEAHRVQHRFAPHALEAADDIGRRVAFGVADVQPVAAGIGEHIQHVQLRPVGRSGVRNVRFLSQ